MDFFKFSSSVRCVPAVYFLEAIGFMRYVSTLYLPDNYYHGKFSALREEIHVAMKGLKEKKFSSGSSAVLIVVF